MQFQKILAAVLLVIPLSIPATTTNLSFTEQNDGALLEVATEKFLTGKVMFEEVIEHSTRVVQDDDLTKGIEFIQQEGKDGKKTHTATEYIDQHGNHIVEYSTKLTPPVDEVVVQGSSPVIEGVDPIVVEAEEKKREEEKKKEEEQKLQEQQQKNSPTGENVSDRSADGTTTPTENRDYARSLLSSEEFACMDALVMRESGWRTTAENPSSGAYGVPQSLPANKMSSHGSDWQTNGKTQIRWMVSYVDGRYGTFCNALDHSYANGWY